MADIVLTGDTSGSITVAAPAVAGTNTITLPAETGTIVTSTSAATNTPIVYVYKASTQSLSEATNTTIQFDTKSIDTDNAFDTSTYEFTVPAGKAGKYQIQVDARLDGLASSNIDLAIAMIYKNGSIVKRNYWTFTANYIRTAHPVCNMIIDLAEGDTIQGVCYINTASNVGGNLLGGVNQSSIYIYIN